MKIRIFCLILSCLILTGCVATKAQNESTETTQETTTAHSEQETTEAESLSFEEAEGTEHNGLIRSTDDLPELLPTGERPPEITVPTQPTVPVAEQSVTEEAEES